MFYRTVHQLCPKVLTVANLVCLFADLSHNSTFWRPDTLCCYQAPTFAQQVRYALYGCVGRTKLGCFRCGLQKKSLL